MPRTLIEIIDQLEAQLRFLRNSGASFDAGDVAEAARIAAAVCILVDDRKSGIVSVLTQAGVLSNLQFLASGSVLNQANLLASMPLILMKVTTVGGKPQAHYLPRFDDTPPWFPPRFLRFGDWWDEVVFMTPDGVKLTRKTLVYSLRDQDGGAHFDKELKDKSYIRVAKDNAGGFIFITKDGSKPIDPGPHFATMRQIGWELEKTLVDLPNHLRSQS